MPIRLCLEPSCPRPAEVRGRCREHATRTQAHTLSQRQLLLIEGMAAGTLSAAVPRAAMRVRRPGRQTLLRDRRTRPSSAADRGRRRTTRPSKPDVGLCEPSHRHTPRAAAEGLKVGLQMQDLWRSDLEFVEETHGRERIEQPSTSVGASEVSIRCKAGAHRDSCMASVIDIQRQQQESMPREDLRPYAGQWVALRDGHVVACDIDAVALRNNEAVSE